MLPQNILSLILEIVSVLVNIFRRHQEEIIKSKDKEEKPPPGPSV